MLPDQGIAEDGLCSRIQAVSLESKEANRMGNSLEQCGKCVGEGIHVVCLSDLVEQPRQGRGRMKFLPLEG